MDSPNNTRTTQAIGAATSIRDTAKWLAGAFSAIGAALLAGAQFSRIGSLGMGRLVLAVSALGFSLGWILSALKIVTGLLKPQEVEEADLSSEPYKAKVNEIIKVIHPTINCAEELRNQCIDDAKNRKAIMDGLNALMASDERRRWKRANERTART